MKTFRIVDPATLKVFATADLTHQEAAGVWLDEFVSEAIEDGDEELPEELMVEGVN